MSDVEVVVTDGIELALKELNNGVGFFGAEGLPKLNAGWVEKADPDGLELNMVVSAAAWAGAGDRDVVVHAGCIMVDLRNQ